MIEMKRIQDVSQFVARLNSELTKRNGTPVLFSRYRRYIVRRVMFNSTKICGFQKLSPKPIVREMRFSTHLYFPRLLWILITELVELKLYISSNLRLQWKKIWDLQENARNVIKWYIFFIVGWESWYNT